MINWELAGDFLTVGRAALYLFMFSLETAGHTITSTCPCQGSSQGRLYSLQKTDIMHLTWEPDLEELSDLWTEYKNFFRYKTSLRPAYS